MKVVTHNDRFHADDVFALAVLRIRFGDEVMEVIRTRDPKTVESADIVFDVGGINDPDKSRFDHHQPEGGGKRGNGFPFAAFGLVWKKWGEEICGSKKAAEIVDKHIVQPVDAGDNGHSFYEYRDSEGIFEYTMGAWVASFGSTWNEKDNYDEAYFDAVDIAEKILNREIIQARAKADAEPIIEQSYKDVEDKRIVILDDYLPWQGVLDKYEEILYVISPSKMGDKWRVNCVQGTGFVNRKDLPESWAGKRDEELEKETGVKGSVFCHRKKFVCYNKTRGGAIEMAKLALEN